MGKTQLALAMAYQIRDEYEDCCILWMSSTSRDSIEKAYLNAARMLGIPGAKDDKADVKTLVRDHLSQESAGRWLLVFDNADDIGIWTGESAGEPGRLKDHLPASPGRGSIIFTTRDKKGATTLVGKHVIKLAELDETGSKQLLRNHLEDADLLNNEDDTKALLTKLTYLPLAISQAASYINENSTTLGCYLSLLDKQEEEVIRLLSEHFEDERRYPEVKNPVATTWLISFEQIRKHDPKAAEYLSFMACVDAKDIPQSLLPPGLSQKEETDAIGTLKGYSFISSSDGLINIHRLVHLATRNWLRKEGRLTDCTGRAIKRLNEAFSKTDYGKLAEWKTYMPHTYHALYSSVEDEDNMDRLRLLEHYTFFLLQEGRYTEAEKSLDRAVFLSKTKLGLDHPDTLTMISNLASTYQNQGRWEEAEKLELRVVETSKIKLGLDHPDTLTMISNLASTYQDQGRWEEAEKLQVQVMETSKIKLGLDHPDTLSIINNLASTYWNQGRLEEAEKLQLQVMETSKIKLGLDHPDTLTITSNLALTYQDQGRWEDTEKLQIQVIETSKIKLGLDHPDTLTRISNLASMYWKQGRWEDAEKLLVQVLETSKIKLGLDHPDTLKIISNLASTYWKQGRREEALALTR